MKFHFSNFRGTADLVRGHMRHLKLNIIEPFKRKLQPIIVALRREVQELTFSFLQRAPVLEQQPMAQAGFSVESKSREVGACLRRYSFHMQARGLHILMQEAFTKEEHLHYAQQLEHPSQSVFKALEPEWFYVFSQLRQSFASRGVSQSLVELNEYRYRIMAWVNQLKKRLSPLQRELNKQICTHAAHVQTVLFYLLLVLVDYANPDLAWRFFMGAPIVGDFYSPALRQREKYGGSFDDQTIKAVARDCRQSIFSQVQPTLTPAAGLKATAKVKEEFASGTLRGPFATIEQLREALEQYVRGFPGFEDYSLPEDIIIISPQFTVAELHAYEEAVQQSAASGDFEEMDYKVRNIFNAVKMNKLTHSFATYVPNTHGDVSVIVMYYIGLLVQFGFSYTILGWPSDFAKAYRQMPIPVLHSIFAATCYYDYTPGVEARRFAFYTSLPFGSSLAPAGWGEIVVALATIMARLLLAVITHCVDDVANFEPEETVASCREAFMALCGLLGLTLDLGKSLTPRAEFIYLGLLLLLPSSINRKELCFRVPDARRFKLISQVEDILAKDCLTTGLASSMRGRLYFYSAWFQSSRSYMAELAARQYSDGRETRLTFSLTQALLYFRRMLSAEEFLEGIKPHKLFLNRQVAWLYTDGMLNNPSAQYPHGEKGIGGVLFPGLLEAPLWYGEHLNPRLQGFDHIAAIEMYAVLRALRLFSGALQGKAVFMFIDNTHAVGALLRRSTMVRETASDLARRRRERFPMTLRDHQENFEDLEPSLRDAMNALARRIWDVIFELDCQVWIEYVWTEVNLADPPSRGIPPPMPTGPGVRVGEAFETEVDSF